MDPNHTCKQLLNDLKPKKKAPASAKKHVYQIIPKQMGKLVEVDAADIISKLGLLKKKEIPRYKLIDNQLFVIEFNKAQRINVEEIETFDSHIIRQKTSLLYEHYPYLNL